MKVFTGARLFDGERFLDDHALVVEDGVIRTLVDFADRPRGGEVVDLGGGILAPGFIDWQINGGGGVLFNADPTVDAIGRIAEAHRRDGTTGFLPTVITDSPEVLTAALAAAREAHGRVPGALGVHVEGPFIDPRRKGVHPPGFIRPMREEDAGALIVARTGAMVVTVAPASVPLDLVRRLADAGIVVSLGHSDATAAEAAAVFDAGARAATHVFNAMSPLGSREPGVVGAALADPRIVCGLIADGEHVHPAACRIAVAAKGPGGIALVSDAMPPAAGGPDEFELHGRRMRRVGRKLVDEAGTLAGATITMRDAVSYSVQTLGLPLASVLKMATLTPARLLGLDKRIGRTAEGLVADLVHLSNSLDLAGVWMGGERVPE
jgi:N-acetylglucosamine-6-phosphate deacetylase